MKKHNIPEPVDFITTAELARILCVDASTVKRWTDTGKLRCYKTVGKHRRFSRLQVEEFIAIYSSEFNRDHEQARIINRLRNAIQ